MTRLLMLIACLTIFLYAEEPQELPVFDLSEGGDIVLSDWKYRMGDAAEWSFPSYNDDNWISLPDPESTPGSGGIRWFRQQIRLTGEQNEFDLLMLRIGLLPTAYEIYWDGKLVGQSGRPGVWPETERPGFLFNEFKLKRALTNPGTHLIAVRLSNHINPGGVILPPAMRFGYAEHIHKRLGEQLSLFGFDAGVYFLSGLFAFALFLGGGRHRSYYLFLIYCLTGAVASMAGIYLRTVPISLTNLPYLQFFISVVTPLSVIMLGIFFIVHFRLPNKGFHAVVLTLLVLGIGFLFGRLATVAGIFYPIGTTIYAVRQQQAGSLVALSGLVLSTAVDGIQMLGTNLPFYINTVGTLILMFAITLSISRQIRRQNSEHRAAELRSLRLEAMLLKKNIQPHFLMNTLLSIISWIEEDPEKAQQLIESLADEFRIINRISSRREIPLEEELELCETHLRLMGYRKEARYRIQKQGLPPDAMVPPMIFHTLIENALTHAYAAGEDGTFRLNCQKDNGRLHFQLTNDGSRLAAASNGAADSLKEGMGMRYVRARLQESYPDRWQLSYRMGEKAWEVDIIIES